MIVKKISFKFNLASLLLLEFIANFCFFAIKSFLILYISDYFKLSNADAVLMYGGIMGLCYLMPLMMGWITDKYLTPAISIVGGLVLFSLSAYCIYSDLYFLKIIGLAGVVISSGLYKPALASEVGAVPSTQKDQAYLYFYIAMNLGSFIAGILSGALSQLYDYATIFLSIGTLMLLSLFIILAVIKPLKTSSPPPSLKKGVSLIALSWALTSLIILQKEILSALPFISLFFILIVMLSFSFKNNFKIIVATLLGFLFFAGLYEQYGGSIPLFTEKFINRVLYPGIEIPTPFFQSINPLIVFLGSIFSLFLFKGKTKSSKTFNAATQFSIGFCLLAISFLALKFGLAINGGNPHFCWLIIASCLQVGSEFLIVPSTLKVLSEYGPEKFKTTIMGLWFMSIAGGNFLATLPTSFFSFKMGNTLEWYNNYFLLLAVISALFGVLLMAIKRVKIFARL